MIISGFHFYKKNKSSIRQLSRNRKRKLILRKVHNNFFEEIKNLPLSLFYKENDHDYFNKLKISLNYTDEIYNNTLTNTIRYHSAFKLSLFHRNERIY